MSWWQNPKGKAQFEQGTKALDAFAQLLRALGQQAFDTDDIPAAKWAEQCDGWAERVEGLVRSLSSDNGGAEVRADWPSLVTLIAQQEAARADQVSSSLAGLRQVVQVCGRSVAEELQASARDVERLEAKARALGHALEASDTQLLQQTAATLLAAVNETNAARREREESRLKLMGDHVRAIKAELSEPRVEATLDSQTGLYNRDALDRHLVRLVDLGPLFVNPPSLILVQLNLPTSLEGNAQGNPALLQQIGSCVAASFLRKQDFVARFSEDRLAVALVDTVLPNVDMLCERLEQSLHEMQNPPSASQVRLTIGASVWALGETSSQWVQRVESLIPDITSSRRRSVQPPPGQ